MLSTTRRWRRVDLEIMKEIVNSGRMESGQPTLAGLRVPSLGQRQGLANHKCGLSRNKMNRSWNRLASRYPHEAMPFLENVKLWWKKQNTPSSDRWWPQRGRSCRKERILHDPLRDHIQGRVESDIEIPGFWTPWFWIRPSHARVQTHVQGILQVFGTNAIQRVWSRRTQFGKLSLTVISFALRQLQLYPYTKQN